MSLTSYPSDLNIEIFKYLEFEDLLNLYKTNKTIIKDIEEYSLITFKKSFKQLYKDYKCLHCNNLCDSIKFKICDYCALDTCWFCYNKVGNENLYFYYHYDSELKTDVILYKCFAKYKCKTKCN